MSNKNVLTKKDLRTCGWRWLLGASTFNYVTQLATSVVFAEMKALRKIYPDDDEYQQSLKNAYKYFNVTPPIAGVLLGATLAMEDTEGTKALDAVTELKVSLMGAMSGIGDTFYWTLIPTVFGSIAAYMGMEGNMIGFFLYAAVNIFLFVSKFYFWEYGYKLGTKILTSLSEKLAHFTEAASVLGLTVVGALIPTVINITTSASFTFGDVTLNLQEGVFDAILPAMLPVLATFIIYKMIKKHISLTKIICGILVVAWLGCFVGIF